MFAWVKTPAGRWVPMGIVDMEKRELVVSAAYFNGVMSQQRIPLPPDVPIGMNAPMENPCRDVWIDLSVTDRDTKWLKSLHILWDAE